MTKSFQCTAGGSIVEKPPRFSPNSKFLLVLSNENVRVFSCLSGDCVQELRHDSSVVGLHVFSGEKNECITCTEDGLVQIWNYGDGSFKKVLKLDVVNIVAFDTDLEGETYFFANKNPVDFKYTITCLNVAKKTKVVLSREANVPLFSINFSKQYVASVCMGLYVSSYQTNSHMSHLFKDTKIVSIACHPVDDTVATGDSKGVILLWYHPLKAKAPRNKLHWHTLPVRSLCFSSEGTYLYSGGHESVIVFWSLSGNCEQSFLPRLGMPIVHLVSSNNNNLAASQSDNGILLIDSHKAIRQHIQGLTYCSQFSKDQSRFFPTGMVWDARTKSIVLNGKIGHLQFFSPYVDKQLFNLDVVQSNYKTEERKKTIVNIDVDRAALSRCGTWLVTIETRSDEYSSFEIRMKFWFYCSNSQSFILNTCVEYPHEDQVLDLAIHGSEDNSDFTVVSISKEGCFKVWMLISEANTGNRQTWSNVSTGKYKNYIPHQGRFSEDGSLIAISFDHVLTLWDTDVFDSPYTLIKPHRKDNIQDFVLGSGNTSHMIVESRGMELNCWNLLSFSLSWSLDLQISLLIPNPNSLIFAAITDGRVLLMTPNDPNPLESIPLQSEVSSGIFVPDEESREDNLYLLNKKQELLHLTSNVSRTNARNVVASNTPLSLFDSVFSKKNVTDVATILPKSFNTTGDLGARYCNEVLDIPAYTIDAPQNLLNDFLEIILNSQDVSDPMELDVCNKSNNEDSSKFSPKMLKKQKKNVRRIVTLSNIESADFFKPSKNKKH